MNAKASAMCPSTLQTNLRESIGFPFHDFFREKNIEALFLELGFALRDRVFIPLITLLAFIARILVDKRCRSAGQSAP